MLDLEEIRSLTKPFGMYDTWRAKHVLALIAEVEQLRATVEQLTWQKVPESKLDNITGIRCRICWAKYPEHATTCPAAERGEE